jgi:hypothetical protein
VRLRGRGLRAARRPPVRAAAGPQRGAPAAASGITPAGSRRPRSREILPGWRSPTSAPPPGRPIRLRRSRRHAFAFAEARAQRAGEHRGPASRSLRVLTERRRARRGDERAGGSRRRRSSSSPARGRAAADAARPRLRLAPRRIQVAIFRWPAGFTRRHPAVIDTVHAAWWRPEGAAHHADRRRAGLEPRRSRDVRRERGSGLRRHCRAALAGAGRVMKHATCGGLGGHDHDERRRPAHHRSARARRDSGDARRLGTSFKTSPAIGRCLASGSSAGARPPWISIPSAPPASRGAALAGRITTAARA